MTDSKAKGPKAFSFNYFFVGNSAPLRFRSAGRFVFRPEPAEKEAVCVSGSGNPAVGSECGNPSPAGGVAEAFAAAFRETGPSPFVKGGPVRRSAFLQENHMNRELIINVTPTEISIALAEDKVLVELNKEQCQTGFSVGDIYLGKVRKIMPGLNAAFVNIGHEKDAFIHYLRSGVAVFVAQKARGGATAGKRGVRLEGIKLEPALEKSGKIGAHLEVGQTVMVQVAKEAISTKGPRLTADISLAGRNVVLVPFSSKVFLSQKIRSADEKKRLKCLAGSVLPKNSGSSPHGGHGGKDEDSSTTSSRRSTAGARPAPRSRRVRRPRS